ncbi:MAG: hypothetical protein LBB80_03010 [Treponema sp.]|jgi:hypothetical protein|nr:hypothetical protein [Treponema sp.]
MNRIAPESVEQYFMNWVQAIKQKYEREIIVIDGKTVQGHFKGREGTAYRECVSDGEPAGGARTVKTEEKSKGNEVSTIMVIPTLLKKLVLEGCIVIIDTVD